MTGALDLAAGAIVGLLSSSLFVVALFTGFCAIVGLAKLKRVSGRAGVVRNLDEALTGVPTRYGSPSDPHGPADQLRTPELLEAAAHRGT